MAFVAKDKIINFVDYSEEDHLSFVTCFNKFHRGGYAKPEYLDKSFLNEKIKSGNLLLTLGKLEDGTVVSVSAAEKLTGAFDGIVELLMRCVDPMFQGCHVGTMHEKYLLKRIKECFPNTLSFQADAVTFDVKSQKTLLTNGFTCCGFCLMMFDSTKTLPILSLPEGSRMTFAIYCKPQKLPTVTVYPPVEHKDTIGGIYERMGLGYNVLTAENPASCEIEYDIEKFEEHKAAEFCIETPGMEKAEGFFDDIEELLSTGYTVAGHINLSHPGCVAVYRRLQKLGFYFAGVRPLSNKGQYLLVAQTENSICGFDSVKLPESEQSLLKYIIDGGKQK